MAGSTPAYCDHSAGFVVQVLGSYGLSLICMRPAHFFQEQEEQTSIASMFAPPVLEKSELASCISEIICLPGWLSMCSKLRANPVLSGGSEILDQFQDKERGCCMSNLTGVVLSDY